MTFSKYEARNSAIAFYDGGWRATDKDDLRIQIDSVREEPITDEELDFMIGILFDLEVRESE